MIEKTKLQKIFKEYDIRGKYPEDFDNGTAYQIARAFVDHAKPKHVVLAVDFRCESKLAGQSFMAGLIDGGADVSNLGVNATPILFFAVGKNKFDGGVMVTASHNPAGYTGFKICGSNGVVYGSADKLKKISKLISHHKYQKLNKKKKTSPLNVLDGYNRFIASLVDFKNIKDLEVVLDSSGGASAKVVSHVFSRLKVKTIKINFKANDGHSDHGLNPMLPENQRSAKVAVKKYKSDLGIIFDGDGDRCIFIDETGQFVEPYHLNCMLVQIILNRWPKSKIIIDARLSLGLSETIMGAGGQPIVHRAGYSNIVRTMSQKKIIFGCENSGHYMFNFSMSPRERINYVFGDSIKQHNLSLSEAILPFRQKYHISGEINLQGVDFASVRKKLKKRYWKYKIKQIDGLSVYGRDWFFNVRPSHTEPLVRINIEATSKKILADLKKKLMIIIK